MSRQHASFNPITARTVPCCDDRLIAKEQTLAFFQEHPEGTVGTLATALCYSKRNTERIVAELKAEGLLARQGNNITGRWIVRR